MNFIAIFLLAILSASRAAVSYYGPCPNVHVVSSFNVTAYLGTWYEFAHYYSKYDDGFCVIAQYTTEDDNDTITVVKSRKNIATGIVATITGSATLDDPKSGLAKLTVSFPMTGGNTPYWVLGTDYNSYTVAWTCGNTTIDGAVYNERSVFIMARERDPSSKAILAATGVLNYNGLDSFILVLSDPTNC